MNNRKDEKKNQMIEDLRMINNAILGLSSRDKSKCSDQKTYDSICDRVRCLDQRKISRWDYSAILKELSDVKNEYEYAKKLFSS